VTVVRDLGVWFDAELPMRSHVSRVAQTDCTEYVSSADSSAAQQGKGKGRARPQYDTRCYYNVR